MERCLTPLDRLFLERANELAVRGRGGTSPNPPVGAVVVRDATIVGEGYHHRAGEAHAEAIALERAGESARGATMYVSLEPCDHVGRTPPCTLALVRAGIARAVIGTLDPSGHGSLERLRQNGIDAVVAADAAAEDAIEMFAAAMRSDRAFVALKMAMSLDGAIASAPGVQQWITSDAERAYVRELRVAHDAVMVGAGTVRVDDPQLTVRPAYARALPYRRVVACETDTVPESSRVFGSVDGYGPTIVLAPAGLRERFRNLLGVAELVFVGPAGSQQLDLAEAMRALRERGVYSVLCEGGPTLAGRAIAAGIVERFYWAIAPLLLAGPRAVPVIAGADMAALGARLRFDRVERAGQDVVLSGTLARV